MGKSPSDDHNIKIHHSHGQKPDRVGQSDSSPIRQGAKTPSPKVPALNTKTNHRQRMRDKLFQAGADALTDHEILEMALYSAMPRIDNKPLVKRLLAEYLTIGGVLHAPRHELQSFHHVGDVVAPIFRYWLKSVRVLPEMLQKRNLF